MLIFYRAKGPPKKTKRSNFIWEISFVQFNPKKLKLILPFIVKMVTVSIKFFTIIPWVFRGNKVILLLKFSRKF